MYNYALKIYVCVYQVFMYVCMHVCMYVCMYVHIAPDQLKIFYGPKTPQKAIN